MLERVCQLPLGHPGSLEQPQQQPRIDAPVKHRQHRAAVGRIQELFERQLAASGPVSASPSPTTHTRSVRGCRIRHRRRAGVNSRARCPRESSPASQTRRDSGFRPGTRTGKQCRNPSRYDRCVDRPRCKCHPSTRSPRVLPIMPWVGQVDRSQAAPLITLFIWASTKFPQGSFRNVPEGVA